MKAYLILKAIEGAPNEFQVLPFGTVEIEGEEDAFLDEESMDSIIAEFTRRGNDMVIDYEHQTLTGKEAPAAGWLKKFVKKGAEGLHAVVEWTERAKQYFANKEYRYFSPVFWVRKADRKIISIDHIALTNDPKINHLRPIIAKMSRDEAKEAQEARSKKYKIAIKEGGHVTRPSEWESVPDDEWLDPVNYRYPCPDAAQTGAAASYWGQEKNQAQYTPGERSIITERLDRFRKKFKIGEYRKEAKAMLAKLKKLFVLADDAGEDKVVEAVEAVMAKVKKLEKGAGGKSIVACKEVLAALGLKEDAALEDATRAVEGLKSTDTAAQELSQQVAKLTARIAGMEQGDLTALALKEGKISPEELEKWGNDLALKSPDQFTKIVLSRPAGSVIPVQGIPPGPKDRDGALSEAALTIAKQFGNTEEDLKKHGGIQ